MSDVEKLVLTNLIFNEDFGRKVSPFMKSEYFTELPNRIVYELANEYITKYNAFPSVAVLNIELDKATGLNENDFKQTKQLLRDLKITEVFEIDYLSDVTEEWCQNRALHLGLLQAISITEGEDKNFTKGAIPQILSDALAVSFDTHIGHDFLEDAEERFDFYQKKEKRIPFHLELLNKITNGGLPNKTLNIILAGINVGKSMFMCDMAAHHLEMGYRVLYITLEMAEERIAERIDANLLDIPIDDLKTINKTIFRSKMAKLKGHVENKGGGRLFIKEYPTACAGAGHFRHLLHELKLKKKFKPDIVYVDYINLCTSSRYKHGTANMNSYSFIKAIAEELRGLAVEVGIPFVSATQLTRSGYTSSDVGMEDTAESFGLPATADFMIALITSEDMMELNQIMVKQLKNRYGNPNINKKFVIGSDYRKMRFYDAEVSAQEDIIQESVSSSKKPKYKERFQGFR